MTSELDRLRLIAGIEIKSSAIQNRDYSNKKKSPLKEDVRESSILSFWVVVDPVPGEDQDIHDICWESTPQEFTRMVMLTSTQTEDYFVKWYNHIEFYGKKKDAHGDAVKRLEKKGITPPEEEHGEEEPVEREYDNNVRTRGPAHRFESAHTHINEDEAAACPMCTTISSNPLPSNTSSTEVSTVPTTAPTPPVSPGGFSTGQVVMHNGAEHSVVLPTFGDKVGIIPVAASDPDSIKLVAPSELSDKTSGTTQDVNDQQTTTSDVKSEPTNFVLSIDNGFNANAGKSAHAAGMESAKEKGTLLSPSKQDAKELPKEVKKGKTEIHPQDETTAKAKKKFVPFKKALKEESETTVTIPNDIKSSLKKKIKELKDESDKLQKLSQPSSEDQFTANFHADVARAFETLLDCLEQGTFEGMQSAQVHVTSWMGPIVQQLPADVYKYVVYGGAPRKLRDLYTELKAKKEEGK